MLHFETVLASTLDLLKRIQAMRLAADMRLVGGTALALHLGHRKSVDLDLFGSFGEQTSFRAELLREGHVIVLAGLEDIAAMKLSAAANRGRKKDFIDISFLLDIFPLGEMFSLYQRKFSVSEFAFALRGLTYFDDAEDDPMPEMLEPVTWKGVKGKIESTVRDFVKGL